MPTLRSPRAYVTLISADGFSTVGFHSATGWALACQPGASVAGAASFGLPVACAEAIARCAAGGTATSATTAAAMSAIAQRALPTKAAGAAGDALAATGTDCIGSDQRAPIMNSKKITMPKNTQP